MNNTDFPISRFHELLQSGQTVLIATNNNGKNNVMTAAWQTPLNFSPALIAVVINGDSLTHKTLLETREAVIAVPTAELVSAVMGCGTTTGFETDKFKEFGLTAVKASTVSAPLINECFANIECSLYDDALAEKYDLFILEVKKLHLNKNIIEPQTLHYLHDSEFFIPGKKIKA